MWDPQQYGRYAGQRARPFFDLLARVSAEDPGLVLDLGCGSGELTATLAERWPRATVIGVDSSAAMIESARGIVRRDGRLSFVLADVADWEPPGRAGVIVSNAVLQWVPGQLDVLARWAGLLAGGGWIAVQVPGNFDQPGHTIMRELAGSARWRPLLGGVALNRQATGPGDYLDLLVTAGCETDAWETTYLHVLDGDNPVLDWYQGTGLRPLIDALPAGLAQEFLAEYGARVRAAYPARPYGTVLPFRRVFAVGHRDEGAGPRIRRPGPA
jgi:trans-aconitate 2-methyltransferase